MNHDEASKIQLDMERNGFNTSLRRYGNSYAVDATDPMTGISIVVHTPEQWEERKRTIAFDREYNT